jgi:hypothetical protein
MVTSAKPKQKKELVLPEKLMGRPKNPEVAFAPRDPVPDVPGILNASIIHHTFKRCIPRPLDPAVGFWDIKVEILREQTRQIRVRKDVFAIELLAQAFMGIDLADDDRVKFVIKPTKMDNGAVFKVERTSLKARLALTIQTWDGSFRHCGIEVAPTATLKEIVDQAQLKIDDERLEEEQIYAITHNGTPASQPWIHKEYELCPKANAGGLGTVKSRYGEMTVPLPLFQKNRWEQIIRNSMPDRPTAVVQTGPLKFQVYYADEEILYHVRFMTDDAGEEHIVSLLPRWENQAIKVRQAFGREMIPDEGRQSKDNVIYVKTADGSPPDPTFER